MVPAQHLLRFADPIATAFPSPDFLPAGVVAVVIVAFAAALVLVSVRRRDAD